MNEMERRDENQREGSRESRKKNRERERKAGEIEMIIQNRKEKLREKVKREENTC